MLERTYKPHYHYQNSSPLANGTDLNREKYAILQTPLLNGNHPISSPVCPMGVADTLEQWESGIEVPPY